MPAAPPPGAEEPARVRISDPGVMRALAHQARLAILEYLTTNDAGTATQLAAVSGLSPSATSYHLRALAKVGLVEQAPGGSDGRERPWRTTIRGFSVGAEEGPDPDPEARASERELIDVFLIREEARTRQWLARRDDAPPEWYRAAVFSEAILVMTADELVALNDQIDELVRPYRKVIRRDRPSGGLTVSMQVRAFPLDNEEM